MKSSLTTLLALLLSTSVYAAGFGELPPGKWWENQRLVEHIKLSEEQQKQINDQVYAHAMTMIDLKADVERAELGLREKAERSPLDVDGLRRAFAAFQTARQRLDSERFEMLLSVRQILSAEQWTELQQARREFERRRGGRPRDEGPPPGPPGGPGGQRRPQPPGGR